MYLSHFYFLGAAMLQPYKATINALLGAKSLVDILPGMLSSSVAAPPIVSFSHLQPAIAAIQKLLSSDNYLLRLCLLFTMLLSLQRSHIIFLEGSPVSPSYIRAALMALADIERGSGCYAVNFFFFCVYHINCFSFCSDPARNPC